MQRALPFRSARFDDLDRGQVCKNRKRFISGEEARQSSGIAAGGWAHQLVNRLTNIDILDRRIIS